MKSPLIFNAFVLNSLTHLNPGQWKNPDNHCAGFMTPDYWEKLASTLEDALFDGVFFADVLGLHTQKNDESEYCMSRGIQSPLHDPAPAVALMASVTRNLCFGMTSSVFADTPYLFTRKMSTLDHLTRGRMAWNIVTSYLPSAMQAMGFIAPLNHKERYLYAEEYVSLCMEMWAAAPRMNTIPDDTFFSSAKKVRFEGDYIKFSGYGLSAYSPQGYPVLYQAGASDTGLAFAAKNAECVFLAGKSVENTNRLMSGIIHKFSERKRPRTSYRIIPQVTFITAENNRVAQPKYEHMLHFADIKGAEILASAWLGIDLTDQDPLRPLASFQSEAIQSFAEQFTVSGHSKCPETVGELIRRAAVGGLGCVMVGGPSELADKIVTLQQNGADGFNLPSIVNSGTYEDFIGYLIPELKNRGVYKTEYSEGTYREKIFGA